VEHGLPVVWPAGPLTVRILYPPDWKEMGLVKVSPPTSAFLLQERPTRQGGIVWCERKLTSVTTLALGFISQRNASTGVDNSRLLDDQTITVKTGNVAARVGKSNLVDFIGVKPDLALSAFQYIGREALLEFQIDCNIRIRKKKNLCKL
jgi:hypothetical protein